MKYKINQKKIKMHNPEGVECETSFFATRDMPPSLSLGEHAGSPLQPLNTWGLVGAYHRESP